MCRRLNNWHFALSRFVKKWATSRGWPVVCRFINHFMNLATENQFIEQTVVPFHFTTPSHGLTFSTRHMPTADYSKGMLIFLANFWSSAFCCSAAAAIPSASVLPLQRPPRRLSQALMQSPCWKKHSALRKKAIPSTTAFLSSFVWEIYLREHFCSVAVHWLSNVSQV